MLLYMQVDKGIPGRVSIIVRRFAKANNPEMGPLYERSKEISYIVYLDANNLYCWAMGQSPPFDDFR